MRIAFVGVGHHHTPFYLEPVRAMPEHTVVGVSDPEPEVARRLAGSLGCGWAAEYGDLLEQTRPDFVFALGRHCDMAAEADALIEHGIPFAIEKPAGLTFGEVQRLAQRAAQRQAFASPCLVMRYNGLAQLLREELAGDRPQYVLFRWFSGRTARYEIPTSRWLLSQAEAGGGCLIHLGVHHLDWFRTLVGAAPISVTAAQISRRAEGREVEDYSLVTLTADGCIGVLETGYLRPGPGFDLHYLIRTDRHHIVVQDPRAAEVYDLASGQRRLVECTTTNMGSPSRLFCEDVLRRAARGQPPLVTLEDMAETLRLVDAAYRTASVI